MPISFSSPVTRDGRLRGAGVTAVLGPTNTGKTHLAIERMLGHSSGMIGLPLRLLAREVYNKVADRVGARERRADHRRGEDQAAEPALLGGDRRGHAARSRSAPSSPSTRCSSAPTSTAATSSPTACSTAAAARRRWCSAPPPSARWSRGCCAAPISCSGRGFRRSSIPATRSSPGCRGAAPSSRSRPTRSMPSPN